MKSIIDTKIDEFVEKLIGVNSYVIKQWISEKEQKISNLKIEIEQSEEISEKSLETQIVIENKLFNAITEKEKNIYKIWLQMLSNIKLAYENIKEKDIDLIEEKELEITALKDILYNLTII